MGGRRLGGGRSQLATGLDEPLCHLGKFHPQQRGTGGEDEIEAGGHEGLVLAEDFAQAALGAGAGDGVADRSARGDHAHAGGSGGGVRRTRAPHEQERAAIGAAAVLAHSAEVAVALHALEGAEALRRRAVSAGHGGEESNDRQPLAALATAGGEDFATALGGLAGAETNLAGALFAVRTECRLHGFVKKRGPKSVEGPGGVKRGLGRAKR